MPNYFLAFHLENHPLGDEIRHQSHPTTVQAPTPKWVPLDNIHITLLYFGPLSDTNIDEIDACCRKLSSQSMPIPICVSGYDFFNHRNHAPAVLTIASPTQALQTFQTKVVALLHHLQKKAEPLKDKPFNAHITLARTMLPHESLTDYLKNLSTVLSGKIYHLEKLVLMHHDPKTHRYMIVKQYPLQTEIS